jgi:hypothetical protein
MQSALKVEPEKAYDPEDPNADPSGYVWVVSLLLNRNEDKLYLCTDGLIR